MIKHWRLIPLLGALLLVISAAPAAAPGQPIPGRARAAGSRAQLPPGREIDQTGYVKGVYVSHAALGSPDFVTHIRELLASTELNAVVLDFKSDRGQLTFPTQVAMAQAIGADRQIMIPDAAEFMRWFADQGSYTIARIPVFKDNVLAQAHPEWAVRHTDTGQIWRDAEGMGWVDPHYAPVWAYDVALAVEAAQMGFDEIQFDYVRFPTDGDVGTALFSREDSQENRVAAIAGLLRQAQAALTPYRVKVAADVFGYAPWVADDLGIGQQIEALAPYLDVLSPMVYPSTFNAGLPGEDVRYRNAIAYPYDIVYRSTQRTVERARAANPQIDIRPWLQDFPDYAFDYRTYTPGEIRQQMLGAQDGGARGWLLWDPAVQYTRAALVSAQPAFPTNLAGNVLVIAYRDISEVQSPGARTPDQLRADLARLWAGGYYPVNLRDLVVGKLNMVPASKCPVILTFDNSSPTQFRLNADGSLDPDTALGILMAFHAAHPADWPLRATFFIAADPTGAAIFGTSELAAMKLKMLVDWGAEVGIQPLDPSRLSALAPEDVTRIVGQSLAQVAEWLPGYPTYSLAWPDSRYPLDKAWLSGGPAAALRAAVLPGGGLAASPLTPQFDPYHIPRVPAADLDAWLKLIEQAGAYYVSAGEALVGAP